MEFRALGFTPKKDIVIPKGTAWYEGLKVLPNQAFGEQVLVAVRISDRWSRNSKKVLVLLLDDVEINLYHRTFPTNVRVMDPPAATEGARILNHGLCRAITPIREEVILLSSEESIA
ncbi:hypothetical protein Hanom_Chr07g00631251 [Helianthus anomalus]